MVGGGGRWWWQFWLSVGWSAVVELVANGPFDQTLDIGISVGQGWQGGRWWQVVAGGGGSSG